MDWLASTESLPAYDSKILWVYNHFPSFDLKIFLLNLWIVAVVQSLSRVWLIETTWTAACQASLFLTISQSLPKFIFIASCSVNYIGIQPSHPLTPSSPSALNLSQHQGLFQWVICLYQMTKILELQLQHQTRQWIFKLISLKIDWFDLLAVQRTFRSLLQHHSLKASILWCSAFFTVQLSQLYVTTGKTIALTIWTFVPAFQHTV